MENKRNHQNNTVFKFYLGVSVLKSFQSTLIKCIPHLCVFSLQHKGL